MAESDAYYRALALIPNFSKPTDECNILDYLHRIEQIGKNFGLTDSQKVDIVSLKSGSAIKDLVDTNSQTTTWKKLSKELIIFFAPLTHTRQLMANFASVRQMPNENIRDFAIRIKTLASYLKRAHSGMPEEKTANKLLEDQLLEYFLDGLAKGGHHLKMARNFDEALEMALKYETTNVKYFSAYARPDFNIDMGKKGINSEIKVEPENQDFLKSQIEKLQASVQALTVDFKKDREKYQKPRNYRNRDFYDYEARNNNFREQRHNRGRDNRGQNSSYPKYRNNTRFNSQDNENYSNGRYNDRRAVRRSHSPQRRRYNSPSRNFKNQKN